MENNRENYCSVIILAAGNSSRMGEIKALLPYKETTLLGHIVSESKKLTFPVIVVLGAYAKELKAYLNGFDVCCAYNAEWKEGMASSIRTGATAMLLARPKTENIILLVADQPFINTELLSVLVAERGKSGKNIIACRYQGTLGTPVLFSVDYFDDLLALQGENGAKKLIKANPGDIADIDFPKGNIDIDTQKDYVCLIMQ